VRWNEAALNEAFGSFAHDMRYIISFKPRNVSRKQLERLVSNNHYYYLVCCEAVRSVILATAWLLVIDGFLKSRTWKCFTED